MFEKLKDLFGKKETDKKNDEPVHEKKPVKGGPVFGTVTLKSVYESIKEFTAIFFEEEKRKAK